MRIDRKASRVLVLFLAGTMIFSLAIAREEAKPGIKGVKGQESEAPVAEEEESQATNGEAEEAEVSSQEEPVGKSQAESEGAQPGEVGESGAGPSGAEGGWGEVGAAGEPTQAEPVDVYKNITKEDFLKEIQGELEVIDEDALGMVSDILVKTKDETGKDLFMFKNQDGSTVKLEDLDKDTLALIHTRVSQARVIVQAQRIQRQIEAVNRDLQTIQTIQQIHASQSQAPRNPQPAAPPPTAAPGQNVQPPPQPPPNPPQPYIPPPQPPRQER